MLSILILACLIGGGELPAERIHESSYPVVATCVTPDGRVVAGWRWRSTNAHDSVVWVWTHTGGRVDVPVPAAGIPTPMLSADGRTLVVSVSTWESYSVWAVRLPESPTARDPCDVNGDGVVNAMDVAMVRAASTRPGG